MPCLPAQLRSKAICLCPVRGAAAPCGRVLTVDQGRELARTTVRRTAEVRVMKRSGARDDELGEPLSGLRPECASGGGRMDLSLDVRKMGLDQYPQAKSGS